MHKIVGAVVSLNQAVIVVRTPLGSDSEQAITFTMSSNGEDLRGVWSTRKGVQESRIAGNKSESLPASSSRSLFYRYSSDPPHPAQGLLICCTEPSCVGSHILCHVEELSGV